MADPAAWYKQVEVVAGPPFCQGKTGYLDVTVGMVYFDPAEEPPTRDTEFGSGYLACLLTLETVRKSTSERTTAGKIKTDVADAFKT
jgi:hypothetical protein